MADNYQAAAALAEAFVGRGLQHVCISPGSRSTPLALAFARHPGLTHWIHHDERSSGFFALGVGRATGRPAAVITTSGTATAELYPATIEARFGRVPLVLLTADRPPELRWTGANQTIDQVRLFGSNVKYFEDLPPGGNLDPVAAADYAAAAWHAAVAAPSGPVHLNLPFDEPLMQTEPEATTGAAPNAGGKAPASPVGGEAVTTSGLPELVAGRRAVLIAGPLTDGTLVEPLVALAEATGVPILADPLSGLRAGTHDRSHVIGFGDALAQAGFLDRVGPEAALRFGPVPVSKAINTWLASNPQVDYEVVDSTGWSDPGGTGRQRRSDPAATAVALAGLIDRPTEPDWLAAWQEADVAAGRVLSRFETFSELSAIDTVLRAAPEPATIWVASSMPIRQVDLLLGKPGRELRLLGNRGASGIDGFVSSALGSATATGERTIAIAGDLSLLYDLTALAWAARHRTEITIVVINNDGGGIFSLLPQADLPEFEELFGTPHGLDFADAALWAGVEYTLAATDSELGAAVSRSDGGPHLIEARFERSASAVAYGRAVTAVADALAAR